MYYDNGDEKTEAMVQINEYFKELPITNIEDFISCLLDYNRKYHGIPSHLVEYSANYIKENFNTKKTINHEIRNN
jgi:hypothetical protein